VGATLSDTYRSLSYWLETVPDDLDPRGALPANARFDVAIIGGGLTGLWTAYYLTELDPRLRVAVLEKHIAGFGASGRNGGWCSALFPASTEALERKHGLEQALAMRRAMTATVDEVARVTASESIDCDFVKGGTIAFARSPVQLAAAADEVEHAKRYGVDELRMLPTSATGGAAGALGAMFDPACARLHPAKLVRGLARVVEARGVRIFEETEVLDWASGRVTTTRGTVFADAIVVATEGYGATIKQTKRRTLPLYSLMIATEPLGDDVWNDIGVEHGQTFTDYRHLLIYGQRTADNRFAFGGRGARYHWGSSITSEHDRDDRVFAHLKRALDDLFPHAARARVTHSWGGPLGVPRDWHASVTFDAASGIGTAGGYVGDGLSTTNLAGRTLADLITGVDSSLTTLAWVNHRSPSWEPEPVRFLGANVGLVATRFADTEERFTHRPSLAARIVAPLTGH
jgi:glycine/D-amino acid oxidase-like deaminating enzyme